MNSRKNMRSELAGGGQAVVYECTRIKTEKKYAARSSFAY